VWVYAVRRRGAERTAHRGSRHDDVGIRDRLTADVTVPRRFPSVETPRIWLRMPSTSADAEVARAR
jgi:hypothetical protein